MSVSKNASLAESGDGATTIDIHKVRSTFYNFASHNASTMSSGRIQEELPVHRRFKSGGKMKFIKTCAMMPALNLSMSSEPGTNDYSFRKIVSTNLVAVQPIRNQLC